VDVRVPLSGTHGNHIRVIQLHPAPGPVLPPHCLRVHIGSPPRHDSGMNLPEPPRPDLRGPPPPPRRDPERITRRGTGPLPSSSSSG
jgi:hypothetical protein